MKSFYATDKDGIKRKFQYQIFNNTQYHCGEDKDCLLVRISDKVEEQLDFFEIVLLKRINYLKIDSINHYFLDRYMSKGIPEAIILEIKRSENIQIRSSSNKFKDCEEEKREEAATAYWKRLRLEGKADYNEIEDYFFTL
ncbi:MAG: hypothetical protein IH852_10510 [Bacteroidetes bacterium]|nr:hypothetical protein [Bacteroidota bacterium]